MFLRLHYLRYYHCYSLRDVSSKPRTWSKMKAWDYEVPQHCPLICCNRPQYYFRNNTDLSNLIADFILYTISSNVHCP